MLFDPYANLRTLIFCSTPESLFGINCSISGVFGRRFCFSFPKQPIGLYGPLFYIPTQIVTNQLHLSATAGRPCFSRNYKQEKQRLQEANA